ncbi:hypothetical protein V6N11_006301 [Hibiscus sabdariffa]|uniref:Uncharacterized protein n=1 Tax=Hibiscus sabdariffa TaxID=183260 RepID=A0ABR2RQZ2_9ROSI
MAMRKVYSEIKGMKVKEVPNYVKPMLSMDYVKKAFQRGTRQSLIPHPGEKGGGVYGLMHLVLISEHFWTGRYCLYQMLCSIMVIIVIKNTIEFCFGDFVAEFD